MDNVSGKWLETPVHNKPEWLEFHLTLPNEPHHHLFASSFVCAVLPIDSVYHMFVGGVPKYKAHIAIKMNHICPIGKIDFFSAIRSWHIILRRMPVRIILDVRETEYTLVHIAYEPLDDNNNAFTCKKFVEDFLIQHTDF